MARTIRTCSLALLLLAIAGTAQAKRTDLSPFESYVQGRALDAAGDSRAAAAAYAAALTAAPGDMEVARRTFRQAIEAGDKALALRAAYILNRGGNLPADGQMLLVIAAVERGDWPAARLQVEKLEDGGFALFVPILRGWISLAARDGDPLATLGRQGIGNPGGVYAREHRILLLLAAGRADEAVAGLRMIGTSNGQQAQFRLAAAGRLVALGRKAQALDVLIGTDPVVQAARARLERGEKIEGGATSAIQGISLLLSRISADLTREASTQTSLSLARLATFADPSSEAATFVLARALSRAGETQSAMTQIGRIKGVWAVQVRSARVDILRVADRNDEALALAEREAAMPNADASLYLALGDGYSRQKRHRDAAKAFKSAIDAAQSSAGWQHWLYYGGALDLAGDWPAARAAMRRAVQMGPDQPTALNHLGYAMLERGDDIAEATKLIARASTLDPDNLAITDSLGWALFLSGQTSEAIALLERAVSNGAIEAEINEHLGDAYWKAGRRVEARYAWSAALTVSDEEDVSARISGKIAGGVPSRP